MCGSFASRGFPEAVRLPDTTQLLLAWKVSLSAVEKPSNARAHRSFSISAASFAAISRATDACLELVLCALASFGSDPTTSTSSGEVSDKSASRFSFGRPASEPRMMSACQLDERYSASSLPTHTESAGVQGLGLYCRMRNSGGIVLSVSESINALTPL